MGKYRKQDRELKEAVSELKESARAIAENTSQTNEKLDDFKEDTVAIRKSSTSKIPLYSLIVAVIALFVTISGLSIVGIYDRWISKPEVNLVVEAGAEAETKAGMERETAAQEPEYQVYLHSEYSTIKQYVETDITATLNFETDAVSITAYYESGGEDTIPLERKNTTEWQKKVFFDKLGVHKVVASATAPNGEIVENSIEIDVIPISTDIDMDTINQFLPTGLQGEN